MLMTSTNINLENLDMNPREYLSIFTKEPPLHRFELKGNELSELSLIK